MSLYESDQLFPERWVVWSNLYIHILEIRGDSGPQLVASFDCEDYHHKKTLILSPCGQIIFATLNFLEVFGQSVGNITICDLNSNTWRGLNCDYILPWPKDFVASCETVNDTRYVKCTGAWSKPCYKIFTSRNQGKFYNTHCKDDDELILQQKYFNRLIIGQHSVELETGDVFIDTKNNEIEIDENWNSLDPHAYGVDAFASNCFAEPVRKSWKEFCMEQVELCGKKIQDPKGIWISEKERAYFGMVRLPTLECDSDAAKDILPFLQKALQYIQSLVDLIIAYLVEDLSISSEQLANREEYKQLCKRYRKRVFTE